MSRLPVVRLNPRSTDKRHEAVSPDVRMMDLLKSVINRLGSMEKRLRSVETEVISRDLR